MDQRASEVEFPMPPLPICVAVRSISVAVRFRAQTARPVPFVDHF
jgi:hypothetical protein